MAKTKTKPAAAPAPSLAPVGGQPETPVTPEAPPPPAPAAEVATVATAHDHALHLLAQAQALPDASPDAELKPAVAAPGCIEQFMDADGSVKRIAVDAAGALYKVPAPQPETEEA